MLNEFEDDLDLNPDIFRLARIVYFGTILILVFGGWAMITWLGSGM